MIPTQSMLQKTPRKTRPRVFFTIRCDVLMANCVFQWVMHGQNRQQRNQTFVLFWRESIAIQSLKLYTD
ncbi:hypothetical protein MCEMIEM12_01034 [Burkholderiaceae bacterium]